MNKSSAASAEVQKEMLASQLKMETEQINTNILLGILINNVAELVELACTSQSFGGGGSFVGIYSVDAKIHTNLL